MESVVFNHNTMNEITWQQVRQDQGPGRTFWQALGGW